MKFDVVISVAAIFGLAACSVPGRTASDPSATGGSRVAWENPSSAGSEKKSTSRRDAKNQGESVEMQVYEVRESAFTDFGMSVMTNSEVKWGGEIEWMRVSAVVPGTSAAKQNLGSGDRIMAIDDRLVTKLSRDAMLEVLFQRKTGDRVNLLVLGKGQSMPRFVGLTANRPDLAK